MTTPPTPRTPDPAEEPVGLERFEDDDVELVAVATVDDDLDDELDEDLDDDIEVGPFVADEGPTLVARLGAELLGTFAFVLVLAINLVGDGLRDALDPGTGGKPS